ncbi:GntR family transcriptional regulator [Kineococcus gynurae]|uniref:GntR family transcriptional regulator n=1 Tax=Kineococcus gynurae TaxID=452979 RepID=A0ABV5LUF1_9ACTN
MRASERAYERLRTDVLDGVLPPGAVLAEVEQAARLGVSRTPVREAFLRLSSEGLAAPVGGRGLVVAPLSPADVTALYELREALEEQAARLAARRGDPRVFAALAEGFAAAPARLAATGPDGAPEDAEERLDRYYRLVADFDAAVDAAVGSPHLVAALGGVRTHLARIRRLARHDPARLVAAAGEHQLIAEAVAAGDELLAVHATHVHLHRSRRHFLAVLPGRPEDRHETARRRP